MSYLPPVKQMSGTQLTQFVVDLFRYRMDVMVARHEINEPYEPQVRLDCMMDSVVLSIEKMLYRTTESTRCEKSEIKGVYNNELNFVPVRLRDHLLVMIGLKRFAKMQAITHTTTILIENKITVVEKHCPHNNIPKDSPQHLLFLVPPRKDDDRRN